MKINVIYMLILIFCANILASEWNKKFLPKSYVYPCNDSPCGNSVVYFICVAIVIQKIKTGAIGQGIANLKEAVQKYKRLLKVQLNIVTGT